MSYAFFKTRLKYLLLVTLEVARDGILQMDIFHFLEFEQGWYIHHNSRTISGFQWVTALSSEISEYVIIYLLEIMTIMGISAQIKIDKTPAYVSNKVKQLFTNYNIKHVPTI